MNLRSLAFALDEPVLVIASALVPNAGGVDEELEGFFRRISGRSQTRLLLAFQLSHPLLAVRGEPQLGFNGEGGGM